MPFIGNQPALSYTSFAKQDFTTSATTSYTLDNPVANENEIALFINFVRQEPTTAYTASGTSLTLTSATSASDDMYCVFLGKAVQTVTPASGSVTNDMISYPLAKSGAAVSTFNRTTSDGTILELQKDGTTVGNIGAFSGNTVIGTDDTGLRFNPGGSSDNITPFNVSSYANRSNAISLGHPSITFKDLYLGGGAYIGGTGTANYLDDYEEGTWTPVFRGSSGSAGSSTTTFTGARYTKIGRLVFATVAFLRWSDRGSYSGDVQIEGLPFTANSTTTKVTGSVAWVKRIQFEGADENDYQVVVEGGTDYMQFYRQTSDLGTAFELTTTAFDDILNSLHISVTYETDA